MIKKITSFFIAPAETEENVSLDGFQRKDAPSTPIYSKGEMANAIIERHIPGESFKNDYVWVGDPNKATAAITDVVSAVYEANSKLSVSYKLADGSEVSPEEAGRMIQIRDWLAASGLNVDSFPLSVTGATAHVGSQSKSIIYPAAAPAIGTSSTSAPTPAPVNNQNDPAGWLFNQLPAGSWRIGGFDADGKPTREVLFYEKKPGKLIVRTVEQAKKLIGDDDAEKTEFGWYLVTGWLPSGEKQYRPIPAMGSRKPF